MRRDFLLFLIGLQICLNLLQADEESYSDCNCCFECPSLILDPYVSMAFGKTIGVDHNYSKVGFWLATVRQDYLFFVDAGWNYSFDHWNGTSLGVGVRFGDNEKGCGINLYWDWLNTYSRNIHQISSGIEGWLCDCICKLNVYLPLKNRFTYDQCDHEFPGEFVFRTKKTLYACQLATLLIGREWNLCNRYISNLGLAASAGPYWVGHSRHRNCFGGLVSIDIEIYNLFSWKTRVSYDYVFKTRVETIISISIPLECNFMNRVCRCFQSFYSRAERFDWIVTDRRTSCKFNW